jgi:oxygen-dependent protoporphyrinogen oxidase
MVAIVFDHNKAPGRAPQGKGLLSTIWKDSWNKRQWDRDDKDIVADAIAGVHSLFPELVADVECSHVQRWRFGPDIPHAGLHRNMAKFQSAGDAKSRIRLAGDYMASASTNASASSAEKAARELAALLN